MKYGIKTRVSWMIALGIVAFLLLPFCRNGSTSPKQSNSLESGNENNKASPSHRFLDNHYDTLRRKMIRGLIYYGIKDKKILAAMGKIRRHMYIPVAHRSHCNPYGDHPCPIGHNQTISQPYIVAYMTEKMNVKPREKILEIGTGSGYQAAVLTELGARVFTIEIVKDLASHAANVLESEGYGAIKCLHGDGYKGWSAHAPFDAVIVTCAPERVPQKLVEQLKENGRMIVPVGKYNQRLVILRKRNGKIHRENDLPVTFVPMVHGETKKE